ncbi:hypothetical protein [uncultured Fusobacterium sp.]|uniref:hypothetical protein n=1 Tax=uncultured Fusobacterium sp. TaxID=159267 RepID=UPI0025DFAA36|nr:hypothetical protein [uncultured Fusobacterium sp.]
MTKKDLYELIKGKIMWNCISREDSLKKRDEKIKEIEKIINEADLSQREKEYWKPIINKDDDLCIHYGNRFSRFKREIRGLVEVRSQDIIVAGCHILKKDIDFIFENGFITKNGNKYILVN